MDQALASLSSSTRSSSPLESPLDLKKNADEKQSKQQEEKEIASLKVQIAQLKNVIHELGASNEGLVSSADHVGLPEEIMIMLEKCPWKEEVLKHTHVMEEAYEWESWSVFHGWSGAESHLNAQMRDLVARCKLGEAVRLSPVSIISTEGGEEATSSASTGPPSNVDSKLEKTYTNASAHRLVGLEEVKSTSAGWEWIGGWRVDNTEGNTDEDGWSYGTRPEEILQGRGVNGMIMEGGAGKRRIRRRRWIRLRLLTSLPHGSEMTNAFLAMRAKVYSMGMLTTKLSEQVLGLQTVINDREMEASRVGVLERQLRVMHQRVVQAEKRAMDTQRQLALLEGEKNIAKALSKPEETGHQQDGHFGKWLSSTIKGAAAVVSGGRIKKGEEEEERGEAQEAVKREGGDSQQAGESDLPLIKDVMRWFHQKTSSGSLTAEEEMDNSMEEERELGDDAVKDFGSIEDERASPTARTIEEKRVAGEPESAAVPST